MKKIAGFMICMAIWVVVKYAVSLTLLEWINLSFLAGIISLAIAAALLILSSGFLTIFLGGFRALGSFITPKSRAMERAEKMVEEDFELQGFKESLSRMLTKTAFLFGLSSAAVSIIGLLLY